MTLEKWPRHDATSELRSDIFVVPTGESKDFMSGNTNARNLNEVLSTFFVRGFAVVLRLAHCKPDDQLPEGWRLLWQYGVDFAGTVPGQEGQRSPIPPEFDDWLKECRPVRERTAVRLLPQVGTVMPLQPFEQANVLPNAEYVVNESQPFHQSVEFKGHIPELSFESKNDDGCTMWLGLWHFDSRRRPGHGIGVIFVCWVPFGIRIRIACNFIFDDGKEQTNKKGWSVAIARGKQIQAKLGVIDIAPEVIDQLCTDCASCLNTVCPRGWPPNPA